MFELAGPDGLNLLDVVNVADLAKNLQVQLSLTAVQATGIADLMYDGQTTVTQPSWSLRRYGQLYVKLDKTVIGLPSRKRRGTGGSCARKPKVQPQPKPQKSMPSKELMTVKETKGRGENAEANVFDTPMSETLKER